MPANIEDMKQAFAPMPQAAELLSSVQKANVWGLHLYPAFDTYSKGNLCAVGDAAHPMLPFMAQGANMALEDAFCLAQCLSDTDDIKYAFQQYEIKRKDRIMKVVSASQKNARNYHLYGFEKIIAHSLIRLGSAIAPTLISSRYDWIYDYDVTKV